MARMRWDDSGPGYHLVRIRRPFRDDVEWETKERERNRGAAARREKQDQLAEQRKQQGLIQERIALERKKRRRLMASIERKWRNYFDSDG